MACLFYSLWRLWNKVIQFESKYSCLLYSMYSTFHSLHWTIFLDCGVASPCSFPTATHTQFLDDLEKQFGDQFEQLQLQIGTEMDELKTYLHVVSTKLQRRFKWLQWLVMMKLWYTNVTNSFSWMKLWRRQWFDWPPFIMIDRFSNSISTIRGTKLMYTPLGSSM